MELSELDWERDDDVYIFSLNPLENSKDSRPPRCLARLAVARLTVCGACRARGRNWGHVVEDLWFLMVEQNSIHSSLFTGQQNITNGWFMVSNGNNISMIFNVVNSLLQGYTGNKWMVDLMCFPTLFSNIQTKFSDLLEEPLLNNLQNNSLSILIGRIKDQIQQMQVMMVRQNNK